MDNIIDILNWLIKPNNRGKLSDCELNYITNSINTETTSTSSKEDINENILLSTK